MSLFVNPTQFGAAADLDAYPRDEAEDLAAAAEAGVDLVFAPTVEEMYPPGFQTWVDVAELGSILEGEHRPGHFRGVATVCLKLFTIVRPDLVYFGQKDAQQVAVLRRMISDLALDLELRDLPTVRDADGLALSSRNRRLSAAERERALALPRALATRDPERARELLDGLEVDYVEIAAVRSPRSRCRNPRRLHPSDRQRPARGGLMSTRPRTPGHGAPGPGKLPITELLGMKESHSPIAMITAYDAPSGRLADAAGADMILVGDSAAMTMLGHDSTVPATMEEMLVLTRAVTRGAKRPLVVADMPFGSFQISDELAVTNAVRFVKDAGADAVKLEGAGTMLSRVRGDRRGRRSRDGPHRPDAAVGDRARRLQGPGPHRVEGGAARCATRSRSRRRAASRSSSRRCPPRSPRRSPSCSRSRRSGSAPAASVDGQVLVWHDLLGLYDGHAPRFVKQYAQLASEIQRAVEEYVGDVRERRFPEEVHTYGMPEEELAAFEAELASGGIEREGYPAPGRR